MRKLLLILCALGAFYLFNPVNRNVIHANDDVIISTDLDAIQDYLELEYHPYVAEFDALQDGVIDSWDVIAINDFIQNRLRLLPVRRGPCPDPYIYTAPTLPRLPAIGYADDTIPALTCIVPVNN